MLCSCWLPGRKAASPLPPPQPAIQLPPSAAPPQQQIDAPPDIIVPEPPKPAAQPEISPTAKDDEPEPEPQHQPSPRRSRPAAGSRVEAPVSPPAVIGPAAPPPEPVPQLGPMLTDEEQRAFDSVIAAMFSRTRQNIDRARTRSLNAGQKELIARAEGFLAQAEKVRRQDPAAAKSLAERAELLSREAASQ